MHVNQPYDRVARCRILQAWRQPRRGVARQSTTYFQAKRGIGHNLIQLTLICNVVVSRLSSWCNEQMAKVKIPALRMFDQMVYFIQCMLMENNTIKEWDLKNSPDVKFSMVFRFPFFKCTLTAHISTLDGSEGTI